MTFLNRLLILSSCLLWALPGHAGSYEDFFRALENDNASLAAELLGKGFDPNTPDEHGQLPLFLALRGGSFKVGAVLLGHPDLKVDAANGAGETALMMAALRGHIDWMQRLLERGARVNKEGWTALHYAASGPESKTVVILIDRGAALDALSPNKTTPLMMAAQYGAESSVALLLARGANPRLRNERGLGAADFARLGGREHLATRLEGLAR